jgi:hypothetical protein
MTVSKKLNDFNLDNDAKDNLIVPTSKIASNFVPIVGPVLAEIVGMLIPNQRQDRIADFLKHLQAIISEDDLERIKTLPERMEILEEGMLQAGLTPHKDRIPRIAQITARGITQDEIDRDKISLLLETIKNISTTDLTLLIYHKLLNEKRHTCGEHTAFEDFQKKHANLFMADYSEKQEKMDFLKRYEQHLISLGLLENIMPSNIDASSRSERALREIDHKINTMLAALQSKGEIKITTLGKELLEYIGEQTN